jgi:hypothetical protein
MAIIVILGPLLVSLGAAAARSATSLPLGVAFVIAIAMYAALVTIRQKRRDTLPPVPSKVVYQALAISIVCLAPFFAPSSNGFVNLGTADGGNHVRFYQSFVSTTPQAYNGFVGFYALIFFFEKTLGVVPELALLCAIGYSLIVLMWTLSVWAITRGAWLISVLALNIVVVVPIALTLQASGFYPQLYGLSLLMCIMFACDRVIASRGVVPLSLAGVGLLRYAYGLTIADVFLGGGIYLVARRKFCSGALLLVLCVYAISRLVSIITLSGVFTAISTPSLIISTTLLLLAVPERNRLSFLLVVSSFVVWLALGVSFGFDHYYIQKYPIGLCLMGGVLALPYVASELLARRVVIVTSLLFLCGAVYPYTRNALDIARRRFVNPEVDLTLVATIRESLSVGDKSFRVFIGNKWARTNMINALFNREYSYQEFESGALPAHSGCVFFDATDGVAQRLKRDKFPEVSRVVDSLLQAPHTRVAYNAPWTGGGTLVVGIACGNEQ